MPTTRFPELEALLREQKDFDTLSPDQRELVLSCCTEEEFRQFQRIVRTARAESDIQPGAEMPERLRKAMQARTRAQRPLQAWINRPVPAWAAAAVLLFAAIALWRPSPVPADRIAAAPAKTDTLWLTRVLHDTIYRPASDRIIYRTRPAVAAAGLAPMVTDTLAWVAALSGSAAENAFTGAQPDFSSAKIAQGFSLHDDSIYVKLMNVVK